MDAAAVLAQAELEKFLNSIPDYTESKHIQFGARAILHWFERWYLGAGHRRLGRMLVQKAKEIDRETQAD